MFGVGRDRHRHLGAFICFHLFNFCWCSSGEAAENKVAKYSGISSTHEFVPLAFETLGPINASAKAFLSALGKRLESVSGDSREGALLFQRLSVTLQRFSCLSLHDSFNVTVVEDH